MKRSNNRSNRFTLLTAAILVVASAAAMGCGDDDESNEGTQTVTHEINEDADFASYKTFDLMDPMDGETGGDAGVEDAGDAPFDLEDWNGEILAEIESQMTDIGLTRDAADPDLRVSYFVNTDAAETSVTFYDYFYGYYWGYEFTWTVELEYDAGTMIIDVVDVGPSPDIKDDVLVFRGIAEGVAAKDEDVRLLQMRNAVDAVFKGWPSE